MGRSIAIANMSAEEIAKFVDQPDFEELVEKLPLPLLKIEEKRNSNKKFDGQFLGFRRTAGSYNQNWFWKDE